MQLLRKEVTRETIDDHMTNIFDNDAAVKGSSKTLLDLSSLMALIVPF